LRGDVVVTPITNRTERFRPGGELFLDDRPVTIASSRPLKDAFVIRFEGVDDRNAAEALRGKLLTASPLVGDDDELWAHEVIGAEVRERTGRSLGPVVAIEANPAHDLLVLDSGALIPVVFVVEHHDGVIVVELPEGLLE
jgi:16S rRNA processing protein RimM